jgi:hypothetical protein
VLAALQRDPEKRPDARTLAARLGEFLVESRFLDDQLAELLRELFGSNTSRVISMPAQPGETLVASDTLPGAPPTEADAQPAGLLEGAPAGWGGRLLAAFRRPRVPALVLAGALGLGLVVWASWGSLRQVAGALFGPRAEEVAAARAAEIVIELDSRPSGALVEREGITLGRTPLTVRLPRSRAPTTFLLRKAGRAPYRYEVTPDRDSIATVELESAPAP